MQFFLKIQTLQILCFKEKYVSLPLSFRKTFFQNKLLLEKIAIIVSVNEARNPLTK